MRGHPFIETLLIGLALACLAFPLHWVTRAKNAPVAVQSVEQIEEHTHLHRADLILRSAHPFQEIVVTLRGEDHTVPAGETELSIQVDPHSEIELSVSATWPDGTPETALYVELAPVAHEGISHTIWGEGSAFETLTFSWEGDGHE